MVLMLNVCLGHLLGDFLLQPGWLVVAKRRGLGGLLIHSLVIMACTALVLIADLRWVWAVVLLAGAAHLCIEIVTITVRQRLHLAGAAVFVLDQLLHFGSLALIVTTAGAGIWRTATHTFTLHLAPTYAASLDGLLFVTVLGSILVFEIDKAVGFEDRTVLPYDLARFLGMAERGASLLAAVALHPALALVPFVQAPKQPRQPRAIGFEKSDFHVWVSFEYPTASKAAETQHLLERLRIDASQSKVRLEILGALARTRCRCARRTPPPAARSCRCANARTRQCGGNRCRHPSRDNRRSGNNPRPTPRSCPGWSGCCGPGRRRRGTRKSPR